MIPPLGWINYFERMAVHCLRPGCIVRLHFNRTTFVDFHLFIDQYGKPHSNSGNIYLGEALKERICLILGGSKPLPGWFGALFSGGEGGNAQILAREFEWGFPKTLTLLRASMPLWWDGGHG